MSTILAALLAVLSVLNWASWFVWQNFGLIFSVVMLILALIGSISDRRKFHSDREEKETRIETCERDLRQSWLKIHAFDVDPNKRRTAIVQYLVMQKKDDAEAFTHVLKDNGWHVSGPTLVYDPNPDLRTDCSARVEVNDATAPGSEGYRYGPTLEGLTEEKVYVVEADPRLNVPVGMRVRLYK